MKTLLLIFFSLFFSSVFSQQFFNEIKTDKSENPLLIKELSTKEILVAVNLSDTNANYNLYKLDPLGHILNSAAFSVTDSIWQLKAIHETSYGYLLCNQIRSKINKRTVFLKFIGLNKSLSVLFNRNKLIVDSATTSHELTTDIDELNGKYVSFSTAHCTLSVCFKAMQYDEYGNILKSTFYLPKSNTHYFVQNIKLKSDGGVRAFIPLDQTSHLLFLDSNLNVIIDTIPKDKNGMPIQLNTYSDNVQIINDSVVLNCYSNFDSSGFTHSFFTLFRINGVSTNSDPYFSNNWNENLYLSNRNLAFNTQNIFTANGYFHRIPPIDDSKIIISKFDFQLNKIWEKEIYSSTYLNVQNVIILSDGSCLILTQNAKDSTQSGTYIIKVSDNGILQAVTNLSLQKNAVKVYPNPGNQFITIEGIETNNLNLVDMLGNIFSLKSTNNIFDTNDLPSGIYFYQLTDKNTGDHFSGKWMKE